MDVYLRLAIISLQKVKSFPVSLLQISKILLVFHVHAIFPHFYFLMRFSVTSMKQHLYYCLLFLLNQQNLRPDHQYSSSKNLFDL